MENTQKVVLLACTDEKGDLLSLDNYKDVREAVKAMREEANTVIAYQEKNGSDPTYQILVELLKQSAYVEWGDARTRKGYGRFNWFVKTISI